MKRRSDLVDRQAELAERVRKLEIMPNPGALTRAWQPNHEWRHIIAGMVTLMGAWKSDAPYQHGGEGTTLPPYVPHASRVLYNTTLAEGYTLAAYGDPGYFSTSGWEWTDFLAYMQAIPKPFWVGHFTGTVETDADAGYESPPISRTLHGFSSVTDGPSPLDRTITWQGLSGAGVTWHYALEGDFVNAEPDRMPPQSLFNPGLGPTAPPYNGTGFHDLGGWYLDQGPKNCVQERANFAGVIGGFVPCIGPNTPRCSDLNPGEPHDYDDGPFPCPRHPDEISAPSAIGSITRRWYSLPGDNISLHEPPRPRKTSGLGADAGEPGDGNLFFAYPGMAAIEDRVAAYLGGFPLVVSFFQRGIPIAQATQTQEWGNRWELFELMTMWDGVIGAQLVNRDRLILRGHATYTGTTKLPTPWEHIGVLPNPNSGLPPANETSDGGAPFLAPVTWPGGTNLEMFSYISNVGAHPRILWDRSQAFRPEAARIDRDEPGPFTINFDGVAFPVRA